LQERNFMQNKKEERGRKLEMITQWQQSGLSQKAFCAAYDIGYSVFHYYYRIYRFGQNTSDSFVPLKVSVGVSEEQITLTGLNGIQVKLAITDRSIYFI
jgi:hypothetical protein